MDKYSQDNYYDKRYEDYNKIKDALWNENMNSMEEEYIHGLFNEEWADKFIKIWNKCSEYTYSVGYYRRPFRTKVKTKLYLDKYVNKLISLYTILKNDFTLEDYLNQKSENKYSSLVIPNIIALEIDENNVKILEKIKDIIYGDNQNGFLTRPIVEGLLMSSKEECYKIVEDLLLAAKLQEGLRQAILESVDETTINAFKYMLKVIGDNDLLRFSSVVRSVSVWTGLALEAQKPSLVKKVFGIIENCLFDEEYRKNALNSNDTIEIYGSIWAEGFMEINNAKELLRELISSNVKYKRLTALYFLSNVQNSLFQYELSNDLLHENDAEILAWANANIASELNINEDEKRTLFNDYKNVLDVIKKEEVFNPSVFSWCQISITKEGILNKMLGIAKDIKDQEQLNILSDYLNLMDIWSRIRYLTDISKNITKKQRDALILSMGDKSDSVRIKALEESEKLNLEREEYRKIEEYLRFKSGNVRKGIINLLLKEGADDIYDSIERLLNDKLEEKKLASLDLIYGIKDKTDYKSAFNNSLSLLKTVTNPSEKMKIIMDKILNEEAEYSIENGFKLYDHNKELTLSLDDMDSIINTLLNIDEDRIKMIFSKLSDLIHEYRDFEYETEYYDGSKHKVILGGERYLNPINRKKGGEVYILDDYPLKDVWTKFSKDHNITIDELLSIEFMCNSDFNDSNNYYRSRELQWFIDFKKEFYDVEKIKKLNDDIKSTQYLSIINTILVLLQSEFSKEELFKFVRNMSLYVYRKIPMEYFTKPIYEEAKGGYLNDSFIGTQHPFDFWIDKMKIFIYNDESFKEFFKIKYNFYKNSEYKNNLISLEDFKRAFDLGLVDENEIYKELMERASSPNNIDLVTSVKRIEFLEGHCIIKEIVPKVISRIIEIEIKRGELGTNVSKLASKIRYFEGMNYFIDILLAFGKDSFTRGYIYMWNDSTKKDMLSHLIKNCHPKKDEDISHFKKLLKGKEISDSRLIDAAMYAPQWISLIEQYLGWKGLSSACWYFHAHVNESFSSLKETMVAAYSPISPQHFRDGAFDINWFKLAYKTLGDEKFYKVYDSAKYITAGGNHKRAQLFSDAILNKLDLKEVEIRISEKRNKDFVLCYGLIPIKNKKSEVLRRYEFLQKFLKETRNFGAQRRESEGKVCAISLDNLSRNAGFENVTRFTWSMESEKIKELKNFLIPKRIGEFSAYVHVDENGAAKLKIFKGEKELKTLPALLKNDAYIAELKAIEKDLKDQLSRAKRTFEKAMEDSEVFKVSELNNILLNPVLAPSLKRIVFRNSEHFGYFEKDKLVGANGEEYSLNASSDIIIAHPYDLYEGKVWSEFQRDIFDRKIIQPFKQVFRELYLINEDEKSEVTISRRYAGHQVQPKKTVALLRSRGWTVHYEEGLQKVYYKANIIAEIYALADWFSPSDVEAPTVEEVRFYERNTFKPLKLEDIPKKIFSEVMRDVDLVVSVAHVGGVDPEASLSTVELRAVILKEILRLLKMKNVEVKGSHAYVKGSLGEYTIHLGSGIVHKIGRGAINILPVHSQHRGRLFLPFIDDDPKTAEVTSKVVFFSEDEKIKDPSVLEQIR